MATEPDRPAVPDYPTDAHAAEIDRARKYIEDALAGNGDDWQDQGERDDVKLSRRLNPADPYAVPTVKGETLVEGATTDELISVIMLPGMRFQWDPRFEGGHMLRRFNMRRFSFYTCMKGMGWLVYQRTIVGVQAVIREETNNAEIMIVQTSIDDDELAPAEDYKVRANLTAAAWILKPVDGGVQLTYIVSISLAGGIPATMTSMLATEIPTCAGRVRDVYYEKGYAPRIALVDPAHQSTTIFQTEKWDAGSKTWTTNVTASSGEHGHFVIAADTKHGYDVKLSGDAASGAKVEDDGKGHIVISFDSSVDKKRLDVAITPK